MRASSAARNTLVSWAAAVSTPVVWTLGPGVNPITVPAARLAQNRSDSISVLTATSFRDIPLDLLDARRKEPIAQLVTAGKKVSFTHLVGFAIARAARE